MVVDLCALCVSGCHTCAPSRAVQRLLMVLALQELAVLLLLQDGTWRNSTRAPRSSSLWSLRCSLACMLATARRRLVSSAATQPPHPAGQRAL